jgi:hypothetical protein
MYGDAFDRYELRSFAPSLAAVELLIFLQCSMPFGPKNHQYE